MRTIPDMNGTATATDRTDSISNVPIPETSSMIRPATKGGRLPWWRDAATREKYNVFKMLRMEGYSVPKAAEAIGYSAGYGETIDRKIKEFETKKAENGASVGFLTDKRIKRAGVVVDKLMNGQVFGSIKEIKDSTALRAAETVLDRQYPKQSEHVPLSLSFVQVNLSVLASGSGAIPVLAGLGGSIVELEAIPGNGPSNPPDAGFAGDGI